MEHNEVNLKITVLTSIYGIHHGDTALSVPATHKRPCKDTRSMRRYSKVRMDDPNITMEEYIRLEEEKAHRHGKVYNWETAKYDMALPPRDQRHQYLRFEGLQYTDADIVDFETRLGRMLMEHRDAQGQSVFTSRAWRRLFEIRGPLVHELILEFFSTFRFKEAEVMETARFGLYWVESGRQISDKEDLSTYWREISSEGDFLGMDIGLVNIPYLLARNLRLFTSRRKQGAMISEAPGPERQQVVVAGAAEDAPVADEGAPAIPAPMHEIRRALGEETWTIKWDGGSNTTTTDSFFKPYMKASEKNDTKKDDEQYQTKRKCDNTSNSINEPPNKRMCKEEKFEAIKYSLGPNEEYIAIRRCEYDAWERNEDSMSKIYQEKSNLKTSL
ncbi:hypothetical protein Tco_0320197 [Tanacetum coccineum]